MIARESWLTDSDVRTRQCRPVVLRSDYGVCSSLPQRRLYLPSLHSALASVSSSRAQTPTTTKQYLPHW